MKILIIGSTGDTGLQLVRQALQRGHHVTALVRDPDKLKIRHDHLQMVVGDVLDKKTMLTAVDGQEAVISALGVGKSLKSNDLITNAVNVLIPVMNEKNVKRLIFLSAFGVGTTHKDTSLMQKIAFAIFLGNIYKDKNRADEIIKNSDLHWTLVCPVVLTNGKHTGNFEAGEHLKMRGMPSISRANVAYFILHQLFDNTYLRKVVELK